MPLINGFLIQAVPLPTSITSMVAYGAAALTVQSASTIDVLPSTNVTFPEAGTALLELYFELYCVVPGIQTYRFYVDAVETQSFTAGISLASFSSNINYTFSFPVSAGVHALHVTATDANGLVTGVTNFYQYKITMY
jgi:hypothetical protein